MDSLTTLGHILTEENILTETTDQYCAPIGMYEICLSYVFLLITFWSKFASAKLVIFYELTKAS